jgi:RHS repeat-associated protein
MNPCFSPVVCARSTELIGSRATANLLTGLGIDAYLTRTDDAGRRGFLTDALGSTIALTADTGAVLTEYTYDPFGATSASGEASANPFQYTGREHDGATGLYYYRTRYYSPELHRFIAEDRLEIEPWETNLYAYVGNDPVGFVDPYGQNSVAIAAGAAALGAAGFVFLYQGGVEALGNLLMALLQMIFDAMNAARAAMNAQGSGSGDAGDAPAVGPSPAADAAGKDGGAAPALGARGRPGSSPGIREFPGGSQGADDLFDELGKGGTETGNTRYPGRQMRLPDGSIVGRRTGKDGTPTVDLNIPGQPKEGLNKS